jgi:hypothetical protein
MPIDQKKLRPSAGICPKGAGKLFVCREIPTNKKSFSVSSAPLWLESFNSHYGKNHDIWKFTEQMG